MSENLSPSDPARQQLLDLGVPQSDLDRAAAAGVGGAMLKELLKKVAPVVMAWLLELLQEPSVQQAAKAPKK